jgi:hypothetical protein
MAYGCTHRKLDRAQAITPNSHGFQPLNSEFSWSCLHPIPSFASSPGSLCNHSTALFTCSGADCVRSVCSKLRCPTRRRTHFPFSVSRVCVCFVSAAVDGEDILAPVASAVLWKNQPPYRLPQYPQLYTGSFVDPVTKYVAL